MEFGFNEARRGLQPEQLLVVERAERDFKAEELRFHNIARVECCGDAVEDGACKATTSAKCGFEQMIKHSCIETPVAGFNARDEHTIRPEHHDVGINDQPASAWAAII
jgi:hypothetical protein